MPADLSKLSTGNAVLDSKMNKIGRRIVSSTAGAVPVKNDKGEATMEKVKVSRYVAGKIPSYADELVTQALRDIELEKNKAALEVKREQEEVEHKIKSINIAPRTSFKDADVVACEQKSALEVEEGISSESEEDEEAALKRRQYVRERAIANAERIKAEEELEMQDIEEESIEEYFEDDFYSEEEDTIPRLKPVFVRKQDRITISNNETNAQPFLQSDLVDEFTMKYRKEESRKIVQRIRLDELREEQNVDDDTKVIVTDDEENDEAEFEAWRLRELQRMKRAIEERQQRENEMIELEKVRNMTDAQREKYFADNPKFVSNQRERGKYKFLQKYFHRGAFYLDDENELYKRNFDEPTLEDKFDKLVLPKVMQVKNFGLASRTKYTHLTDQDTTDFFTNRDEASASIPEFAKKFGEKIMAGVKGSFEKPSIKRKRSRP